MKTSLHMINNFVFVIFSLLLLCIHTKTATSFGHQLAATYANGAIHKCLHKERQALLDFKSSLYDYDGQLSTWRLEDDCCKWSGVTCNNQTGHVTKLNLSFYFLKGEISPSLLNLSYLNHLDLSHNSFNGSVPNFIGSMTRLIYLDLKYNWFNGTIPKSIGSMTQLRYLDLSDNFFVGTIPKSIGSLTRLTYLSLSWNMLNATIPRSIGFLTKLMYLDLSDNYFVGTIPPEFGNLKNLRNLSLEFNSGLMIETSYLLSNLSHLQHLNMNRVSLAKVNYWVDAILSLQKLSYLNLEGCNLSAVLHPHSSFVNSSSSIEFLSLRSNNLNSSMYDWLFSLTSSRLLSLDLSSNMLNEAPKYLGNLGLTSLYLNNNSVSDKFDDFVNNLSGCTMDTLRELDASHNQFTGSLPNEIQKFSSLQSLILSHNHLNGTMSDKVWELPNLQVLDVSSNFLASTIFTNIGKSKLREIDLSNNKISNTIPVEFWNISSQLMNLNLSSNNISGKVPDLSSNFDPYSSIDLSSNNFYGTIPSVPSTLEWLNLSKNKLHGGISLCQIVDSVLIFLDLSHNYLTEKLPDCWWHFKDLRVLNLGHNNLSGSLPASIGHLVQLEVLHLYSNNFVGELPSTLRDCTELTFLNLGANNFSGNVPVWVGESLTELYTLSIRSNNLFGPIPLQLCHLKKLRILDLSMNNLNGTIPSCVNNLSAMVDQRTKWWITNEHSIWKNISTSIVLTTYVDNAMIEWQGNEHEFTTNLGLLKSIDFSSNNLTGHIPNELIDLHELLALNLSKNNLVGEIPRKIGEMKKLLTLDLSRNHFSGGIPSSMSQMTLLNCLDVSYNNLSGRIPTSTQLQSFEPSRYAGNDVLCGLPTMKSCPGDEVPPTVRESGSGEEDTDELQKWFYLGGGIGFATGFWIACSGLLLNHNGRRVFFRFVDFLKDWVYVKVVVFIRELQRVGHT